MRYSLAHAQFYFAFLLRIDENQQNLNSLEVFARGEQNRCRLERTCG